MQTTDERRDPRLLRVPLERVEVELAHEEFDDVFEADGIDVGEGGLALRSAILPDVGARLRCAFASPLDGASIVADGEVVWAHDSGPHLGEFGVRFDDLDEASEASLRRIVEEHEDRALTQAEADELGWPSSPGTLAAPTDDEEPYAEEEQETTIALALDGVSTEMIAEIVHAADDAMLVEQALPFLRLGTGLTTEDGRRGSIEGIELRLDEDTPRLVLTVVFDSVREPLREHEPEAPPQELLEASDVDTVPDAALPFEIAPEPVIVAPVTVPVVEDVPVVTRSRPSASLRAPEPEPVAQKPAREPSVKVKREPTQTFRLAHDEEDEAPSQKRPGADALATFRTRFLPALVRFFATLAAFMQRTYRVASPKIAGALGTARSRASHMITSLRAQQRRSTSRPRAEAAQAPRRRTQGGRPSVAEATTAPTTDLDARKRKNRIVLGLAAGTILVGAIGLMSEEPAPAPAPVVTAPAPEPVVTAPAEPVVLPTNTPVAAPAPAPEPTAPAGGQIEQPTFPTIGASDETTARSVTPAARSMTYGADSVPNGQTFVLDMTTPVESVEGEETENGFRVRLTHTNSNSRASPIAQQHPRVDRASILNQGENAELRIDFLASGRKPAYRVEARGRQLRVILGR